MAKASPQRFKKAPTFEIGKSSLASMDGKYPTRYFKAEGKTATCIAGANLEGLFTVKRNGVLGARGDFK